MAHDDFAATYQTAIGGLVGYFRGRGLGLDDSHDLAHETVVRTLVHLKRHGRTRADLGPLTRTIARNLLIQRIRRSAPSTVSLTDAIEIPDDAPEPHEQALTAERREAVRAALQSLTPRHRRAVELWMQGRTPAEIARELGIKRNAADAILHRARRTLASRLGPRTLWGLLALAWLKARSGVRAKAQTVASFIPTSPSVAEAGLSLATIGLATAITLVSTGGSTPQMRSPANPESNAASSVTAGADETVATPVSSAAGSVGASRPAPGEAEPYGVSAETEITHPTTGGKDDVGVGLSYDPAENGRGPIDHVLEPTVRATCDTTKICMERE